jgi:signal transduction histidine kinase
MEEEIIRGETAVPFSRSITIESTVSEGLIMAPTSNEQLFLGSVTRLFWLAAIGAIAFTGLLGLGLSRRILQPVESLTLAAHQMATGDLSQRVAVQRPDEIGQLATAFNQMADSLARQETLRRHLVTDVAHELRTPLSNIRGYLEAVQDGVLPSDAATIDTIHEEALLLSRLIEDLQELSLAEAGQLRLERQALSLIDLVKQAVNSVRPLAISQTITLRTELPDDLPPVWADRERVGQLLRNLLRNAMSHTPPAGTITITAVSRDEAVQVSVRDTGEGIAPEHIPHIFDRFYRADPSRDRASGSAGLGLAIAKAVVELHHGRIWVESQPGMGAVFTFTLPVTT